MQRSLFRLNLLEAKTICVLIKVVQRGPVPLLVFLRILLLQSVDILCQFLKYLLFKLALWLARACLCAVLAEFESLRW